LQPDKLLTHCNGLAPRARPALRKGSFQQNGAIQWVKTNWTNDLISKSEKEDFLAAKALDENWSQAKCMKFGIDRFMLKRARRMTAAG
jgi:hypothetical protein